MIINKPFKTYRQQLRILRERNLQIPNGHKAMKILKRENYYSVINGYKDIFLDPRYDSDVYKDGTSFDDIYALYCFDRNLRSIALKYILRMESSLKTKIAYRFSEKYPTNFNYFDIKNFKDDVVSVTSLIAHISNDIKNNVEPTRPGQPASSFSHYLEAHKELPLWVLIKKLTLGETSYFYTALDDNLQTTILTDIYKEYRQEYRLPSISPITNDHTFIFAQMLRFVVAFRNICAHGERMYDHVVKHKNKIPKISFFYMNNPQHFTSKFIDVLHILGLFLLKSDYKNMIKEITDEIELLSKELQQSTTNAVLVKAGFPKDWKSALILPS